MEKPFTAVFRNVGQLYFPQTRVECHYSLSPEHQWSSSDWVGIFEVGWSSVKEYYTYTWAVVPEGYAVGAGVDCCVLFHARYLPRPSAAEYQFVYVNAAGEACARSRTFTFCAPKPLEELETLKEERDEEDGEEELLLVVPRAQLLQSRLEDCLHRQGLLQQALDAARQEAAGERESGAGARAEWERERRAMREERDELRDKLRQSCDRLKRVEGQHKDVKYSQESLTSEVAKLAAEKSESQQRIQLLEEEVKLVTEREKEGALEVERLKERAKKTAAQMKHDEDKRKCLQAENEAALQEARRLRERQEAGELAADALRRELRELGVRQGRSHAELHQARMQVAQLTLQLSEENLGLREERAAWALEREAHKQALDAEKKKVQELSCEVQRKEEWLQEERTEREKLEAELARERDCSRELLSELNGNLRTAHAKREEQQREKEDLLNYICELEQRLGVVPGENSNGDVPATASALEDEQKREDASSAPPRSICSPLFLCAHMERPDRPEAPPETSASDTQAVLQTLSW
ncbi:calcium-binding and coiled-coil domain-containing protein 1b isoform X2 [Betta splendens]|nr:calcium-binding and coiled-coil domain-containing protein 1b isoform X2 [Betta splendens]XP_055365009.1 calcium-binding and coiled-coil domain-containing protein 1b isoform X2 [Betta splendens]XP_055365010.1 calcium-binding and coiled-coil domain-containing protein 1b isoform X2 [Betta splendens]